MRIVLLLHAETSRAVKSCFCGVFAMKSEALPLSSSAGTKTFSKASLSGEGEPFKKCRCFVLWRCVTAGDAEGLEPCQQAEVILRALD